MSSTFRRRVPNGTVEENEWIKLDHRRPGAAVQRETRIIDLLDRVVVPLAAPVEA